TNQGTKKASDIAKEINGAKSVKDKLDILRCHGIDIPESKDGTTVTDVTITTKPNGIFTVNVKTNTPNTAQPNQEVSGIAFAKSDATINQPGNLDAIKRIIDGHTITNQGKQKVSDIGDKITRSSDIKAKLAILRKHGIFLPDHINETKITDVEVITYPDGTMKITVSTHTPFSYQPNKKVDGKLSGKSDATINQPGNLDAIKKAIDGHTITNQGKKKVSDIAKDINKATTVKDKLDILKNHGIDIPESKDGTTVTGVKVTAKPDGTLKVEVATNTPNASQANKSTSGTANGKSDATLDQPGNLDAIKKAIHGRTITNQGTKKASDIAKEINGAKSVKDKLDILRCHGI
ncbi:hypothetical protein, partial [Mycoplasma todarodis]